MCLVLGGLCAPRGRGRTIRHGGPGAGKPDGPPAATAIEAQRAGRADRPPAGRQVGRGQGQPARPADDAEFLRRVYLDLVGKIPTAAEARDFLDDPSPDKRTPAGGGPARQPRLSDARHRDLSRAALARGRHRRPDPAAWRRRSRRGSARRSPRTPATTRSSARSSRSASAARDAGEATPTTRAPSHRRWPTTSPRMPSPRTSPPARRGPSWASGSSVPSATTIRSTSGSARSSGAWPPSSPASRSRARTTPSARSARSPTAASWRSPARSKVVKATFLDGKKPQCGRRASGRELLADWVTAPDNPYFARAAVNRVWARFFGTGLVDPVDDLRAGQPAVSPRAARPAGPGNSGRTATT